MGISPAAPIFALMWKFFLILLLLGWLLITGAALYLLWQRETGWQRIAWSATILLLPYLGPMLWISLSPANDS